MADIITRNEVKAGLKITGSGSDAQIDQYLPWVSTVIRNYTDRDFATTVTPGQTRNYPYEGQRYVEIDDCTNITNVALQGRNLGATEYRAGPPEPSLVFYWIELYQAWKRRPGVDAAGFTSNRDRFWPFSVPGSITLAVTADFGWATAPGDVKLAAVEIIRSFGIGGESSGGGEKQSEAIDSYAISWQTPPQDVVARSALPRNAVDILDQYRRINL